jgi:hypothetical protein
MDAAHLGNLHSIHTPGQAACCTGVVVARSIFIVLLGGVEGRARFDLPSIGWERRERDFPSICNIIDADHDTHRRLS